MGLYICILTHLWQLGHYAYILALTYGIKVIATSQTGQPACQLPTRQPKQPNNPACQPTEEKQIKQTSNQTNQRKTHQPTKQQPPPKARQPTNKATYKKSKS